MNSEIKITSSRDVAGDVVEFGWVVVLDFPTSTWAMTFLLLLWTKRNEWICAVECWSETEYRCI